MEQNLIQRIILKYLSGRFPAETEERVQKWIVKEQDAGEKEKASLAYWDELQPVTDAESHLALARVNRRIGYGKARIGVFYRKMARTAAVLLPLLILTGGYLYYSSTKNSLIEISVAYGEKRHLLLPDSSEVWLNAGTVLKYPERFADARRQVYLDGEACFSVRKNAEKPFIVQTSRLSVKVLGTRFNVKAYSADERITTTLSSGKVEVSTPSHSPRILKPNEQLTYDKRTSHIGIARVPAADAEGWMTGKLIFTDASLAEIQQTLERRYNVVIRNATAGSASGRYTVRFLKNENIDEVLSVLGDIIGFDYQKKKNGIRLINKP